MGFRVFVNFLKTAQKIVLCVDTYFSETNKDPELSKRYVALKPLKKINGLKHYKTNSKCLFK